ncbi:peroxidase 5-like [Carex rostrata]
MAIEKRGKATLLLLVCAFWMGLWRSNAQLQVGYYDTSCPAAEIIVQQEVSKAVNANPGIAAGLLRLHFHDCFVRGCDASVLLDSTTNNTAEKDAPPNTSLRGFEVIDNAKARLEEACFGVVSCADILAFAARDGVAQAGGQSYPVPSGRRDGIVSTSQEALGNLPPPSAEINQMTQAFANKGFTQSEMVALSGAHTIGLAHCSSFSNRLYNYGPTASQDPNMDPGYVSQLQQQCPQGNTSTVVPMDPSSPNSFDTGYFNDLLNNRGLFTSDQTLTSNQSSAGQVILYANNSDVFFSDFSKAMVKMGYMEVLTGSLGEIRSNCRVING